MRRIHRGHRSSLGPKISFGSRAHPGASVHGFIGSTPSLPVSDQRPTTLSQARPWDHLTTLNRSGSIFHFGASRQTGAIPPLQHAAWSGPLCPGPHSEAMRALHACRMRYACVHGASTSLARLGTGVRASVWGVPGLKGKRSIHGFWIESLTGVNGYTQGRPLGYMLKSCYNV